MPQHISITKFARNMAEYVNRVLYRGERFVLVRGNKSVAEICPLPEGKQLAELPALLASLPHLSETEADAFDKDLAAARNALSESEMTDPWPS